MVRGEGAIIIHTFDTIPTISIQASEKVAEKLERMGLEIERVTTYQLLTQETPWGIERVGAPDAWSTTKGNGTHVAVLDTGIDTDHPDLETNIEWATSTAWGSAEDKNGHGTWCAGIVAALDNDIGVVGVAPEAGIYSIRVFVSNIAFADDIAKGIEKARQGPNGEVGPDADQSTVISMSFGGGKSDVIYKQLQLAYDEGIVLVAAAGNSAPDTDTIEYPAAHSEVIAVAATDDTDTVPDFSSRGIDDGDDTVISEKEIELAAPGVGVKSTWKDGTYETHDGTSASCPHVSGTVALIKAVNSSLTV